MKLIIAGSRTLEVGDGIISSVIAHKGWTVTRVISGGARGIDLCGERWAENQGIPYVRFVPGWGLHGRKYAAYVRNHDMGFYGDALLAIWDGESKGTRHMIETMKDFGKPYETVIIR